MWSQTVRYALLLALQAPIGCFLLAYGKDVVNHSLPLAALLAVVLVALNTGILCLYAGFHKLNDRERVLFVAAVVFGGAVACLGAGLAGQCPAWNALTVAGTLFNMELAHVVAKLQPLAVQEA